jgi:hypothetical protein
VGIGLFCWLKPDFIGGKWQTDDKPDARPARESTGAPSTAMSQGCHQRAARIGARAGFKRVPEAANATRNREAESSERKAEGRKQDGQPAATAATGEPW